MAELGWFANKRVQLIQGEIVEMAPMGTPHWVAVNNVFRMLNRIFLPERYTVTMQCPIDLNVDSEPEPDITVIEGIPADFTTALPTPDRIRLLVEVADSSLRLDKGVKVEVYATAGIDDYWIVSLPTRTVEIFRKPVAINHETAEYGSIISYGENEKVSPLSAPDIQISIKDMLPPI